MLKKSKRLLLVEDDDSHAEIFAFYAQQSLPGLIIDRMRDGEEAVRFFTAQTESTETLPELIVLDLNLPRYSGHEVLAVLQEHPFAGRIPVVLMSCSSNAADIHKAYASGANSYMRKPAETGKFKPLINEILAYWQLNERDSTIYETS